LQPLAPQLIKHLLPQQATTWFVLHETTSLILIWLDQGNWRHWVTLPTVQDEPNGNAMLLEREVARLNNPCRIVTIMPVGSARGASAMAQILQTSGWQVRQTGSARSTWAPLRLAQAATTGGVA
jgi:hypothetical protein